MLWTIDDKEETELNRMAKKKPTRRGGRPKAGESVFTPKKLQEMGAKYLRGESMQRLADEYGVVVATIWEHINRHIRPVWQQSIAADLDADLVKVAMLEAEAWKRYETSGQKEDLADAWRAIEHRAKIFGFYAAKKHDMRSGEIDIRVAGKTPSEYAQWALGRIMDKAEELKRRDQAMLREQGGRN